MEFGQPEALAFLWLAPLAFGLVLWAERRRIKRLKRFAQTIHRGIATRDLTVGRGGLRALLITVATTCFVVAAAKPRWGFEWREVKTTGSDIMIAVDVSKSMLAQDVSPNRLERAKREIVDLMRIMGGDRLGLIAFAGRAFVQCPLTIDYGAINMFLDFLDESLIPVQGTSLNEAIDLATDSLVESSEEFSKGRALILITDGEDHSSATKQAMMRAKENGVKVFIVGVGTEAGAPIPSPSGGFKKDRQGNVIVSKLNTAGLNELASTTGGIFVKSVSGDLDLEKIYFDGIKGNIDETEYAEQKRKVWYERFQWFVLAGLLLIVIEGLIPRGRPFRPARQTAANIAVVGLLLFLIGVGQDGFAQGIRSAEKDFKEGRYNDAREKFEQVEIADPDDPKHAYNRGVSAYRDGDFDEAAEAFGKAADKAKGEFREQALYNKGNAHAMKGQYDKALESYQGVLQSNPDSDKTKENMAYVEQLKKMQQQQQQKGDQNQDKNQQQNEQQQQQQGEQNQQQGDQNQQQQQQQGGQNQQQANQQKQQQGEQNQQQQSGQQGQPSDQPQPAPPRTAEEKKQDEKDQEQAGQQGDQQNQQGEQSIPQEGPKLSKKEAERLINGIRDRGGQVMRNMMRDGEGAQSPPNGKDW